MLDVNGFMESAQAAIEAGRFDDAMALAERWLGEGQGVREGASLMALALHRQGRNDEALEWAVRAVEAAPEDWVGLNTQGAILRDLGRWEEAEAAFREALRLAPGSAEVYANLGISYLWQQRSREAVAALVNATQLQPDLLLAHYYLSLALRDAGNWQEAAATAERVLDLHPDFPQGHLALAFALLSGGEYERGFQEYEWRLDPRVASSHALQGEPWDGVLQPSTTLLLNVEQTVEETIQFLRYVPFIAEQGVRVVLRCPAVLERLAQGMDGVAMAVTQDEAVPTFDSQLSLSSLPYLFGTTLDKIPLSIPYLRSRFDLRERWRERLSAHEEGIMVGVRWNARSGRPDDLLRSVPLGAFSGLAAIPGVRLVSLQSEPLSEAERGVAEAMGLVVFAGALEDFEDTLALMDNLDMVISVDDPELHLAGALGRPTWGLLPHVAEWRWLLDRDDSPWYPSLRLFRQPVPGDWEDVFARVTALFTQVMADVSAGETN